SLPSRPVSLVNASSAFTNCVIALLKSLDADILLSCEAPLATLINLVHCFFIKHLKSAHGDPKRILEIHLFSSPRTYNRYRHDLLKFSIYLLISEPRGDELSRNFLPGAPRDGYGKAYLSFS